jgi:hypothetical protein
MKAALSFSLTAVLSAILTVIAAAQDLPAKQSLGISFGYSPDSSHILIGISEQRRTWTGGVEYGRTLYGNNSIRADYEASVSPFFLERDPTASGSYAKLPDGSIENFPGVPTRVVKINGAPIGYIGGIGPTPIPIYADGFGTEETYAASISPLGARINGFNLPRSTSCFHSAPELSSSTSQTALCGWSTYTGICRTQTSASQTLASTKECLESR